MFSTVEPSLQPLIFIFWGVSILSLIVVRPIYSPTTCWQVFIPFTLILTKTLIIKTFVIFLIISPLTGYGIIFHCGFSFWFLNDWKCWVLLMSPLTTCVFIHVLCPFSIGLLASILLSWIFLHAWESTPSLTVFLMLQFVSSSSWLFL